MGEEAPAPAGKVMDLSGIKTAADHSGKEPTAPNVADRPPEIVPDQKRRGRPPKEQAGMSAGKRRKRRSPAQAARLRLTRWPVRRPRPLFWTKWCAPRQVDSEIIYTLCAKFSAHILYRTR